MGIGISDYEAAILSLIGGGEMFGQEMLERSHGQIPQTTHYVRLGRMLRKGLLTARPEKVEDRTLIPRRLYRVTAKGKQMLAAYVIAKAATSALPEGGAA